MRKLISDRRIDATATLLYLKNPAQYEENFEKNAHDTTFRLPDKSVVRKYIQSLVKRLYRSPDQTIEPSFD